MAQAAIAHALEIAPAYIPAQLVRFDLLETAKEFELLAQSIESFLSRPDLPDEVTAEQGQRLTACLRTSSGIINGLLRCGRRIRSGKPNPPQTKTGPPRPGIKPWSLRRKRRSLPWLRSPRTPRPGSGPPPASCQPDRYPVSRPVIPR